MRFFKTIHMKNSRTKEEFVVFRDRIFRDRTEDELIKYARLLEGSAGMPVLLVAPGKVGQQEVYFGTKDRVGIFLANRRGHKWGKTALLSSDEEFFV